MKKFTKLLVIGVMASPIVASAQVNVTTATTKRVAVVEEFTGNYCTACPLGHKELETISNKYPGRVIPIKIQYGGYSGTDPIFGGTLKTTDGDAIAVGHASNAYPNVKVSRVGSPIEGAGGSANTAKESAVVNIINQDSPVNMYIEGDIDATTRVMNVSVEYYYTANEANSTNYLHIGYYQDNIPAYQYNSNSLNPAKVYMS